MPKQSNFSFALYRLNVKQVVEEGILSQMLPKRISSNQDILDILKESTRSKYDQKIGTTKRSYIWSIRDFEVARAENVFRDLFSTDSDDDFPDEPIARIKLARSLENELSPIVTDDGIIDGTSISSPPPAKPISLFFFLYRHIVAVEYSGELLSSNRWKREIQKIFLAAASNLKFSSQIILEPIPSQDDIMETFNKFHKLTRIKVHLLLPNPDLKRSYKKFYDQLSSGEIREIIQDMRNSEGISKAEGELAHSSASMAQAGYKEGPVEMTGDIADKKNHTIMTGETAMRGRIKVLKEHVQGMKSIAKTRESQNVLRLLYLEIEDILGPSETEEG